MHMKRRFIPLYVGLVMLQGVAYGQDEQGQETTGLAATRQLTQADLDTLEQKIQERFDTAFKTLNEKIDGLAHRVPSQNDDLETVRPVPPQESSPANATENRLARLENDVAELGNMLRSVTAQAEGGGAYWRFDTNSQPARQEFDRALRSTVPPQADFVVVNRTARDECIYVNGQRHTVKPGTQLTLKVPPGTVTARLPHQQQPLALHVGFPNYYQSVDIKERPATQAYAQVVSEPAYWVTAY
jgi:TolA-binding protein